MRRGGHEAKPHSKHEDGGLSSGDERCKVPPVRNEKVPVRWPPRRAPRERAGAQFGARQSCSTKAVEAGGGCRGERDREARCTRIDGNWWRRLNCIRSSSAACSARNDVPK